MGPEKEGCKEAMLRREEVKVAREVVKEGGRECWREGGSVGVREKVIKGGIGQRRDGGRK